MQFLKEVVSCLSVLYSVAWDIVNQLAEFCPDPKSTDLQQDPWDLVPDVFFSNPSAY